MSNATPSPGELIQGRVISDVDWANADLSEAVFEDCTLRGAHLSGVVLEGARFIRCQLVDCRFSHVEAVGAVFETCVLTNSEAHKGLGVIFSRFEQARFLQCDLSFSTWERSDLHGLEMQDCNLRGAQFERTDFSKRFGRKLVRTSAAFRRCNFHLARISGLDLKGCDFEGSLFREADLSGTDLEAAILTDCDFFGAALTGARLAHADLRRSEISGLDLEALASRVGMKITIDQQQMLLAALGVEVSTI
ncbi:MAG: pentapeptide repeat-containing protein [Caulobacteraceae bacterium]